MDKQFYSAAEMATMLGVAKSTILSRARAGAIPALRIGRLWRFPKQKVESWLEQQQQPVSVPTPSPEGDAETQAWLEEGVRVAAHGIQAAEQNVPPDELQDWLTAMAHAVTPLETGHV